jgi:ACS family hexuronate transporter-like MFS transporter
MSCRIPYLRWWITALLFLSTVINYVDRQTLSILARTIQNDLGMSDLDYAHVVQAFLLAYTLAYLLAGRVTDLLGTRLSLALFLGWWSLANLLTAFARSALSLGVFRFLLGLGEAGNYTAAPKAVSEWFQPKERALAVGIYTAGAMVGATISPPLISWLGGNFGWRMAFVATGGLGLLWLAPWLWLYREPWRHPRITPEEAASVLARPPAPAARRSEWQSWKEAASYRAAWLLMSARLLTDSVWYFYLFWFPKYLMDARGLSLAEVGRVAWVVYLAADLGSVIGGALSGRLIRRGHAPVRARLYVMGSAALLAPLGALMALRPPLEIALLLAALVSFCHLTWQVTLTALVVDLIPQRIVATVFGLVAAGSGLGGLLSTDAIGRLVTAYSYAPVFALMAVLHPAAFLLVRTLRRGRAD